MIAGEPAADGGGPARASAQAHWRPTMQRIQIIGPSCAGKTTLGLALAQRLGLPFTDLDDLFWEPGWREAAPEVFVSRLATATAGSGWVLAGNYLGKARAVVWPRLDQLVVLDQAFARVMARALHRTMSRALHGTPCCNGNTEQLSRVLHRDGVLRYTARTWHARHRLYATLPTDADLAHTRVTLLTGPTAVARWLAEQPGRDGAA
jgi:adenylate kinase family enzyme